MIGNNNFNALQATLERRFVNGLLFQAHYMWSHGITDASIGAGESVAFQNQSCRACDRSDTNIDVRHVLTIDSIYQLPFGPGKTCLNGNGLHLTLLGWMGAGGIVSARSGLPINITVTRKASDLPDGNTSGQRPNLVLGCAALPGESDYLQLVESGGIRSSCEGDLGQSGSFHRSWPWQLRNRHFTDEDIQIVGEVQTEFPRRGIQPVQSSDVQESRQ